MSDNQPKCHKCKGPRIAGHCLCRDCWERWRTEVMKPDPKTEAVKTGDKETGEMFK